jgi:AmiR/NasT family two-component response regulator
MIGAAVGIIMAFYGVTESAAFQMLKKTSMDRNVKLRAVAEEVVLTGSADGLPAQ